MMFTLFLSAAVAQVARNPAAGGCQYLFNEWTGCQYASTTACQRTRTVKSNVDLHLAGQSCATPGSILPDAQGREPCTCTEPYTELLGCGYEFSEWTGCTRVTSTSCQRTRLVTKNAFLFTEGLACYFPGQQHPTYGAEACTDGCAAVDPVAGCGYEFNAWTACGRDPSKTDCSCHQTRTVKSASQQRLAGLSCYTANSRLPGELGERTCACPARAALGAACATHADCESELCHSTTKQCANGAKYVATPGCLYQMGAWTQCALSSVTPGTCERTRAIEAVARECASPTASCYNPGAYGAGLNSLTYETCPCDVATATPAPAPVQQLPSEQCTYWKDRPTPSGKTFCTDEGYQKWQAQCLEICR